MNQLQEAIYHVIKSIINTKFLYEEIKKQNKENKKIIINNSAIRYGLLNYIAKFSLANDEYFITKTCYDYLCNLNIIRNHSLLRSKKGTKFKFTFEHPVPSNVIADLILENRTEEEKVLQILKETDKVTILTYKEDAILNKSKLTSSMPNNWKIFKDSPFKRYEFCKIDVPIKKIKVYGALAR